MLHTEGLNTKSLFMEQNKKTIVKNYVFNLISQVMVLIIPLITSPYLARVLHEEGTGKISFSNSIITYFILIANLGFTIYGQREIARVRDDINKKSQVFFEIIIIRLVLTIVSLLILYTILFTVGFGEKYNYLILIFSITILAVAFDITFYFQGIEDFKTIAIRSVLVKLAGMILIFIFVKTENDLWIYAFCLSATTIISNLLMWPKLYKQLKKPSEKLHFARHFRPSMMVFLPALAVTVYSVLDKTMIGFLSSNPDYDNGCYEKAYQINSMALLLITVISPVMIPRNAYQYSNGDIDGVGNNMYFTCNYVWLFGLPLIAGFAVLSWNLSSWFLGDGFKEVPIMLIIMSVRFVSSGLAVVFGDQFFIIANKEKYCLIATMAAALLNFGLNFLFIPKFGAIGAAITTAIAEVMVTFVLALFIIKTRIISIQKVLLMSWKYLLASAIMFISIFFIQKQLPFAIWTFLLITFIGATIYFSFLLIIRDKFIIKLIKTVWSYLRRKKQTT